MHTYTYILSPTTLAIISSKMQLPVNYKPIINIRDLKDSVFQGFLCNSETIDSIFTQRLDVAVAI